MAAQVSNGDPKPTPNPTIPTPPDDEETPAPENDGGLDGADGGIDDGGADLGCVEGQQDHDGDGVCEDACGMDSPCVHGTCDDQTGTMVCSCDAGFAGPECDTCAPGHQGEDCAACEEGFVPSPDRDNVCVESLCSDTPCGDQGKCILDEEKSPVCKCSPGWTGKQCDECDIGYQGKQCGDCAEGYELGKDLRCTRVACLERDCGNGVCVDSGPELKVFCECETGWAVDRTGSCTLCAPGFIPGKGSCIPALSAG